MKVTFTVCGIGILTVIAIAVIREIHASYVKWITLASLIVCSGIFVSSLGEAVTFISEISVKTSNIYTGTILKGLGITILTGVACEICQSVGELTVSRYIETVGKIEMLILSVPLFRELLGLISL